MRSYRGLPSRRTDRSGASNFSVVFRGSGSSGWRSTPGRGPARRWRRIWLDERHGVRPEVVEELPLGVSVLESTADAVLLIGDRAMRVPHEPFHEVVDLAEAWQAMTGLPFVFALWVARGGVELGDLPEALARSRAAGLAHAADLAGIHGPRLGLDFTTCYDYLTRVLSYDLGESEIAGLMCFAGLAARLGLAPEGVSLVFHRRRDFAPRR